jgi:hypothetical protein
MYRALFGGETLIFASLKGFRSTTTGITHVLLIMERKKKVV